VDSTYRTELRELNELNFARLEAKLVKWMFVFWAPTALAVVALLLRS
jgi:hypothetical protein